MKPTKLFPALSPIEFWAERKAQDFYTLGLNLFFTSPSLVLPLSVKFFKHKSKTAGWANYTYNEVRLNANLLNQEGEVFTNTISHEVAHILSNLRFGRAGRGHNKLWQQTWKEIDPNAKLTRCHNYDAQTIGRSKKYNYKWVNSDTGEVISFMCRNRGYKLGLNPNVFMKNDPSTKGKMFLVKI